MLTLHYHELIGYVKEDEGHLIIDDYMLDKALDKIKEIIGVEKFDNTMNKLVGNGTKLAQSSIK